MDNGRAPRQSLLQRIRWFGLPSKAHSLCRLCRDLTARSSLGEVVAPLLFFLIGF